MVYRCAAKIDGVKVAGPAILRGRYVIPELTQGDHIVVAVGAGRLRVVEAQIMVERAGHKRARCVAVPAIPVGWVLYRVSDSGRHMGINQGVGRGRPKQVNRFSCRSNAMTGIAARGEHGRIVVVDANWRIESVGGMARLAIDPIRMGASGRDRCPARRVDTIGSIVACNTGQYRGIDQTMIENAIQTESRDAMTVTTIDGSHIGSCHHRMPHRRISNIVGGRYSMTGITTGSDDGGIGVVGEGAQETGRRMTANALSTGNRMGTRWVIGSRGRFAGGCAAVVATRTATRNTRVIELTVRAKFKKTGGIVAVIALGAGRLMKLGFTDCQHTVMALTAVAKHFLVVDRRDEVKSQRGMAGLTHTAGGDVIQRFPGNLTRAR